MEVIVSVGPLSLPLASEISSTTQVLPGERKSSSSYSPARPHSLPSPPLPQNLASHVASSSSSSPILLRSHPRPSSPPRVVLSSHSTSSLPHSLPSTPPPHLTTPDSVTPAAPSHPPPLAIAASTAAFSELSPPSSPVVSSPRRHSFTVTLNLEPLLSPPATPHQRSLSIASAPEELCTSHPSPPAIRRSPSPTSPSYSPPPSPIPSPPLSTSVTERTITISAPLPPSSSPPPFPPPPPLPATLPRKPRLGFKMIRSGSMRLPKKANLQSPVVLFRRSPPSCPNTPASSPPPVEHHISSDLRRRSLPQGQESPSFATKIAERKSGFVLQCSRINNAVIWGAKVGINSTLRRTWSNVRAGRIEEDRDPE